MIRGRHQGHVDGRRAAHPHSGRGGSGTAAALGMAAAIAIFVAVPAVLCLALGIPTRSGWSRHVTPATRPLFDALGALAWSAWLGCCVPLVRSVLARVRTGDVARSAGGRLGDRLAASIAAAVLTLLPVSTSLAGAAVPAGAGGRSVPAAAAGASPRRPATTAVATAPATARPAPAPAQPARAQLARAQLATARPATAPAQPAGPDGDGSGAGVGPVASGGPTGAVPGPEASIAAGVYVVEPGDSLWSIAQHLYEDAGEWQAIAAVNFDRVMPDGARFVDPSLIRPGWRLALPDAPAVAPAAGHAVARPSRSPEPSGNAGVAVGSPRSIGASMPPDPARTSPEVVAAPAGSGPPTARPTADEPSVGPTHGRGTGEGPPLPTLAALGIGAVAAAALARRARRRDRDRGDGHRDTPAGAPGPDGSKVIAQPADDPGPSEAAEPAVQEDLVGLAVTVSPFEATPALDWLELADRLLALPSELPAPRVQLFRVGPDGVDAWLTERTDWAPPPWERRSGGRVWHLSARHDRLQLAERCRGLQPVHPAMLPIGADGRGTWLAVADAGCCLPIIGAGAEALVATMAVSADSWPWSDQLTVTVDPAAAIAETGHGGASGPEGTDPDVTVLFVGDPALLPASTRRRCAVVTTLPVPSTGLTVAVDARAATIHPLGVTVRPHVLAPRHRRAVDVLARGRRWPAEAPAPAPRPGGPAAGSRSATAAGDTVEADDGLLPAHLLVPGP
ncbi:MAG TPA: LysM domain-containing protein, partial [Acidimicrobiales bacterium]